MNHSSRDLITQGNVAGWERLTLSDRRRLCVAHEFSEVVFQSQLNSLLCCLARSNSFPAILLKNTSYSQHHHTSMISCPTRLRPTTFRPQIFQFANVPLLLKAFILENSVQWHMRTVSRILSFGFAQIFTCDMIHFRRRL